MRRRLRRQRRPSRKLKAARREATLRPRSLLDLGFSCTDLGFAYTPAAAGVRPPRPADSAIFSNGSHRSTHSSVEILLDNSWNMLA